MKTEKLPVLVPDFFKRKNLLLGLVPVTVQDHLSREVIMSAYADKEAFFETLKTGYAHFFSTSRNKIWKKGEESGNTMTIKDVRIDCDGDALLYIVILNGPCACHTGNRSCFWRSVT